MVEKALDSLQRSLRRTLQKGEAIAIVGWRETNHDEFTRSLPAEKVVFTTSMPPEHVGYVLFTKAVTSQLRTRISRGRSVSQMQLDTGQVKELLLSCKDLMHVQTKAEQVQEPTTGGTSLEMQDEILDFLTKPQKDLDAMEKFAAAFLAAGAANNNGWVGRRTLGGLIKKYGAPAVPVLIGTGWIVAKLGEGKKKVGWYQAGEKMLETGKKIEPLPDDSFERARVLIASKEEVLAKKAAALEIIASCDLDLIRIQQAEELLTQLSMLLKF